ncbi:MAG: ChbG/HpnK family deacetylase [Deltaproteobacteria bacterium]|nr:ChbG/HpnK family deacetylase [Deltaproteobacteria bacterium]
MKYLIINADDFGANICRNRGIAEAVDTGVVTSVSVLVNGPAFDDALARLPAWQGRGVSVGLHVNLSEGYPVCKGLSVLPDDHGCFRGKSSTHKLLMQKGNHELEREVALEIEAQIGLLESKAIRISHLDGHQHVHVFPAVIGAAVRAAQRHGIVWLRIPEETATVPPSLYMKIPPTPLCQRGVGGDFHASLRSPSGMDVGEEESSLLKREANKFIRLAAAARPFLKGSGIRTTDHFRGLYLKGRLSFPRLEELLNDLSVGITELMVHPGRAPAGSGQGPFAAFSNVDREGELNVLLDPRLLKVLKEEGVFLTPYPEIQS